MFDLGALLTLVGQDKTGQLAAQLDSLGIPPPNDQIMKLGMGGQDDLGGMMRAGMGPTAQRNGVPTSLDQQSQIIPTPGQAPVGETQAPPVPGVESPGTTQEPIGPWDTQVNPAPMGLGGPQPVAASQGANQNSNMLAALSGLKAQTPVQPFTHGGVVGGVKAPEIHPANPAVISGIIQMLMHPHASGVQPGPSLGQLIR